MTPEQREKYIAQGGVRCPYCGSEDLDGGSVQIDRGTASQDITCLDCGKEWEDTYVLVNSTVKEV